MQSLKVLGKSMISSTYKREASTNVPTVTPRLTPQNSAVEELHSTGPRIDPCLTIGSVVNSEVSPKGVWTVTDAS